MGFSQFAQFFKVAFETLGNKQTLHLLLIEIPTQERIAGETVSLSLAGSPGRNCRAELVIGISDLGSFLIFIFSKFRTSALFLHIPVW